MSVLYTNNATTTLASGISDNATSITVASGTGALFPTISGSDYFNVTLTDSSKHIEIVKVTARSGDVLTVTRAQEGTSARAWLASDILELRITKNMLDQLKADAVSGYATAANLSAHTGNTSNPHSVTATQVGLGNVENKSSATIRSEITSSNVTTALGYTPYNSTNPAGYTTNTGTVTGVTGTAPIVSSGGTAPAISISAATTSAAGSMSAADKTKLDGIATGATANTGTVTSVGGTGSYGGLTLSGTVTSSGNLTLGGTPTGTWPISVSGSSASCTGNAATATSATSAGNADTLDGNHASAFQAALVSGSNIKTVGGNSLLGSGDISVGGAMYQALVFTASATYTPSARVKSFYVFMVGATGGLRYSGGCAAATGGSGGGGYLEKLVSSPSGSYSIVIGAGGAAGAAGGTTSVTGSGVSISITGSGGVNNTPTPSAGGVASGGYFNANGGSGGTGAGTAPGGGGGAGSRAGVGGNGGGGGYIGGGGTGGNNGGATGGAAATSEAAGVLPLPFASYFTFSSGSSAGSGATCHEIFKTSFANILAVPATTKSGTSVTSYGAGSIGVWRDEESNALPGQTGIVHIVEVL